MKVLDESIESSYFSDAGDKIKWGPYGKCTFPQNVLGQMQVFRKYSQRLGRGGKECKIRTEMKRDEEEDQNKQTKTNK